MIRAAILAAALASIPAPDAADPPMVIQIEGNTVAVTPAGDQVAIPTGSRIDACLNAAGLSVAYDVNGRVMRVLTPCIEFDPAAVFADGFEQP